MTPPPTQLLPPKKDVASLLLQGPSVFVHLDPRKPEVVVPLWFKKQPQLVLQLGLNMVIPIPDLHLDDQAITATLSFNRAPFWCKIPWTAVYALVGEDGRGMIWPDEVPSEVAAQMGQAKPPSASPKLRAVPTAAAPEPPAAIAPAQLAKETTRRPSVGSTASTPAGPPAAEAAREGAPKAAEAKARRARKPRTEEAGAKKPTRRAARSPKTGAQAGPDRAATAADRAPKATPKPAVLAQVTDSPQAPLPAGPAPLPPAQPPVEPAGRRKRELPPYLRVIK